MFRGGGRFFGSWQEMCLQEKTQSTNLRTRINEVISSEGSDHQITKLKALVCLRPRPRALSRALATTVFMKQAAAANKSKLM